MSDRTISGLTGASLGIIGGVMANKKYNECTREEKKEWSENRIAHHGAVGLIITIIVICLSILFKRFSESETALFLMGLGIGLMITDLNDIDRWFTEGTLFN